MKEVTKCLFAFLVVNLIFCPLVRGGEIFRIQRIRIIPNPVPEKIEGEEVLAVTFKLMRPAWVDGVGWSLHFYDEAKSWMATSTTAYFLMSDTPRFWLQGRHFKGEGTFTALFPLWPGSVYTVIALGNQEERKVVLFPYTGLLQEFNVLEEEILEEIARSGYKLLSTPVKDTR